MRLPEDMSDDEVEKALQWAGITPALLEKASAVVSRALWLAKAREELESVDFSLVTPWVNPRPRYKK